MMYSNCIILSNIYRAISWVIIHSTDEDGNDITHYNWKLQKSKEFKCNIFV